MTTEHFPKINGIQYRQHAPTKKGEMTFSCCMCGIEDADAVAGGVLWVDKDRCRHRDRRRRNGNKNAITRCRGKMKLIPQPLQSMILWQVNEHDCGATCPLITTVAAVTGIDVIGTTIDQAPDITNIISLDPRTTMRTASNADKEKECGRGEEFIEETTTTTTISVVVVAAANNILKWGNDGGGALFGREFLVDTTNSEVASISDATEMKDDGLAAAGDLAEAESAVAEANNLSKGEDGDCRKLEDGVDANENYKAVAASVATTVSTLAAASTLAVSVASTIAVMETNKSTANNDDKGNDDDDDDVVVVDMGNDDDVLVEEGESGKRVKHNCSISHQPLNLRDIKEDTNLISSAKNNDRMEADGLVNNEEYRGSSGLAVLAAAAAMPPDVLFRDGSGGRESCEAVGHELTFETGDKLREDSVKYAKNLSRKRAKNNDSVNHQLNLGDTQEDTKSSSAGSIEVLEVCFQLLFALMI